MTATKYQSVLQNQRKNPFLNKSGSLDKSLQLSIKENKTPITLTKHGDLASHRSSKSLGYMTMTTAKKPMKYQVDLRSERNQSVNSNHYKSFDKAK